MNFRIIAMLLALPLASCAATVDLDDSLIQASSEPGVLAVVRERIEKMAVDEQRLYWFGQATTPEEDLVFLRSCEKHDCASTLVTYGAGQATPLTYIFSVNEGQIYWDDWRRLFACPTGGCSGSPRTLANEFVFETFFDAATFDSDRFYFSNDLSLYSLSLTQPDAPQAFASLGPRGGHFAAIAIHDAYAYGLVDGFGSVTLDHNTSLLVRTPKDGSASVETIASDVRYSNSYARGFGLAADTTSIYWTNNLLVGSINRCPVTGCGDGSEVVISPLRAPQALQIDGSELYYVHEPRPYQYTLSTCTLPACTSSLPLIERLDAPGALAMDDEYLYVATTEQDGPSNQTENTVTHIRRLPKPQGEHP